MTSSQKKFARLGGNAIVQRMLALCLVFVLVPLCVAAQQGKNSGKGSVAGRYEGSAKNRAEEVITVTFELTEKEGAMSGMIRSSHGDFTITGGSHHGEEVTLEFDAGGPTGTITLKTAEDKMSGTWNAGDDGGTVEVKRAAAQAEAPKGKS
jgi:hypothetical protein